MISQFVHTKCHLPAARPNNVPRDRLDQMLQGSLLTGRKLTLISAPAGYGKTTLAAAWVQQTGLPVAWLSLDEQDNEFSRFLAYLLLAVEQAANGAGAQTRQALDKPQLPPVEIIVANFCNDLAQLGKSNGRFLLALDDYHKIRQPLIHELLNRLLDHLPPACHLLLISREDPPLPLPRLRVRGELTEIRIQELRFTISEAEKFFNQTMQLGLPPDWVAALEARTEGWIASLQLAALSLQGRNAAQTEAFIRAFGGSHRYVFDYLAEEVLGQQPEEIREFLRTTAVLDRFNASLCQALTGRADSQAILQRLEQANLFLVPLDDRRVWFRYHHLFADYLRSGLAPAGAARYYRSSSRWCEENGLLFEAVQYALASGDLELAGDTVERIMQQAAAWSGGELATLISWIDALPGQIWRARPRLSLQASRALFLSGRLALSAQLLDHAEAAVCESSLPETEREGLLALTAVYRAAIAAFRGEIEQAIELATEAQAQLPANDIHARARAADTLGLAYKQAGDLQRAAHHYTTASDLAQAAGVAYLAVNARCEVALALMGQGRLAQAAQTCRDALALINHAPIPPTGLAWAILGLIAYEQNELATAENLLQKGLALSQQGGLIDDLRLELLWLARLQQAMGNLTAAETAVTQAAALTQTFQTPHLTQLVAACQAQIQLAQGNLATARQWAEAYVADRGTLPAGLVTDIEELILARVWLALGELAPAEAAATAVQHQAAATGRQRTMIESLIVLALIQQAQGRQDTAVATLSQALQLAAPAGFARLFLDEGRSLMSLLRLARPAAPGFVDKLFASLATEQTKTAVLPNTCESLSEQELNVLRLLCAGLSNREIAEKLFISPGTAKWHVHNILQKLGVNNRAQAILRARELGLAE